MSAGRRTSAATRGDAGSGRDLSAGWAWHAAWTGNADWAGTADWTEDAARAGWPERVSRASRTAAASRTVAVTSQVTALLLAVAFWGFAAHRVPAPVLAVDTAAALCVWLVVQLARDATAGAGAHRRLRAGLLAACGAALLAGASGWLIPGLAFLSVSPGFLILLPLAAASGSLWQGRPRGPAGPRGRLGAEALGGAAVGLARLGTIIALSDTGASQAHLALLAWLAPVALAAGPRCGWLLWQSNAAQRPAPFPSPAQPPAERAGAARPHPLRAPAGPVVAGRAAAGRLLAGGAVWPMAATALVLLLVGRQADAASGAFALAVFVILAVGRLVEEHGPAVLPGVVVALVAAPLPWAALSPEHVGAGTACCRLLLLIMVIDAVTAAEPTAARTRPRALGALAGLITLVAVLPAAASAYGVAGWALALLLGRFVAAVPAMSRRLGRPGWLLRSPSPTITEKTRRVT
ncbi:hypothetical protein [Parafrankia colletiae]|uniref:hypothetical protein n=1 Tax=Parafrankia colletiae TaxID=573497 RepID=UPI0010421918|nr:hypothetical protein [Parafrankia colletiae]